MEIQLSCEDSSEDPIDTYVVTASAMLVVVKLVFLRTQRSNLSVNISHVIRDWCGVDNARSREIMIRYARMARTISLSLFYSGFFAFTLYMLRLLPVLTANERPSYLPTSCVFESVSNLQYALVTLYQVIQLFIAYAGNCCTEGMFVGVTLHLCGQLELLMIGFRQIDRRRHEKTSLVEDLVVRHRELLGLAETIEDTYNIIILTQIFTSAILICVTGELTINLFVHNIIPYVEKNVLINIFKNLFRDNFYYLQENYLCCSTCRSFNSRLSQTQVRNVFARLLKRLVCVLRMRKINSDKKIYID